MTLHTWKIVADCFFTDAEYKINNFLVGYFFLNRIQYLEEISEVWLLYKHVCPEMVAEKMRDFGLNVSVCVSLYECVSRGQLWQPC